MATEKVENEFVPEYAVAPGETLLETIEEIGMTQAELARRMGRPLKTINEIVQGKAAITPETALQLERVLGVPASYWLKMEQNYREDLARLQDAQALQRDLPWLNEVPVREMIKRGWIKECANQIDQLREVLKFYAVATVKQWSAYWENEAVAYRQATAYEIDQIAVTAWLRAGEIEAQQVSNPAYDAERFKQLLRELRSLTKEPLSEVQAELVAKCAEVGVTVVFLPELPRTRVCGTTRWLNRTKPLIQLSYRYKWEDQIWFSFFHEAAHVLLHRKQREMFLEYDRAVGSESVQEQEADRFAQELLIPNESLQQFLVVNQPPYISKVSIKDFAGRLDIGTGVVVGRLQHDDILPKKNCNDLRFKINTTQDEQPEDLLR